MPRLPRKSSGDVSECHACHAKGAWRSPSATLPTAAPRATNGDQACHHTQPSAVSACHAKAAGMSPSATPATQRERGCRQVPPSAPPDPGQCCKCHPATQIERCSSLPHSHTPHSTPSTPNFTLNASHSTTSLHTSHSPLYTPHFPLSTSNSTLHTPHCTHSTSYSTLRTTHFTLHTLHSTLHTSHTTLHTLHASRSPHSTLHASHSSRLTLDTPHSALSTAHSTLHTPESAFHTSQSPFHNFTMSCFVACPKDTAKESIRELRITSCLSATKPQACHAKLHFTSQNDAFSSISYGHGDGANFRPAQNFMPECHKATRKQEPFATHSGLSASTECATLHPTIRKRWRLLELEKVVPY